MTETKLFASMHQGCEKHTEDRCCLDSIPSSSFPSPCRAWRPEWRDEKMYLSHDCKPSSRICSYSCLQLLPTSRSCLGFNCLPGRTLLALNERKNTHPAVLVPSLSYTCMPSSSVRRENLTQAGFRCALSPLFIITIIKYRRQWW